MQVNVFQIPKGQRRAGLYTFAVDGKLSYFYSTQEWACWKRIKAILDGPPKNAVRLKVLKSTKRATIAGAKATSETKQEQVPLESWHDKPTREERLLAFLKRGKQANRDDLKSLEAKIASKA